MTNDHDMGCFPCRQNEWSVSGGQPSAGLIDFIDQQVTFVRQHVKRRSSSSKYWRLMGLMMDQFEGLVEVSCRK